MLLNPPPIGRVSVIVSPFVRVAVRHGCARSFRHTDTVIGTGEEHATVYDSMRRVTSSYSTSKVSHPSRKVQNRSVTSAIIDLLT